MEPNLVQLLQATAEIYGKQMSAIAAKVFVADLDGYPEAAVKSALARCRKELRTFPTISDIVARIDDGRPGVEEAWAMIPHDEAASVVWTDEMAEAFGMVRNLVESDPIAARMAFKEQYVKLVTDARANRKPPRWTPSIGHDRSQREAVIRQAIEKGRLPLEQAVEFLPERLAPEIAERLRLMLPEAPK